MQRNNSLRDHEVAGHRHIRTKPTSHYGFGGEAGGGKGASTPFGLSEKMRHVMQNLPTLRNLGPFQVVQGIPNIEALTHFLPLGIGGFKLTLGLRSNSRRIRRGCIGRGCIRRRVGWNIGRLVSL